MYNFTSTSAATAAAVAHQRRRLHALIALVEAAVHARRVIAAGGPAQAWLESGGGTGGSGTCGQASATIGKDCCNS